MHRFAAEWATAAAVFVDCRERWRSLAVVGVVFRVASALVIAPLYAVLLHLTLLGASEEVLTDLDLLYFATSPVGIAGALALGVLVLTAIALEGAAMLGVLEGPRDASGAIGFALSHTLVVCRTAARLVAHALLWLAPALAVGAITYYALLSRFDINYYLTERPPAFWGAAAVLVGLTLYVLYVAARLAVAWSIALPVVLFEQVSPKAVYATSHEQAWQGRWPIRAWLVGWALLSLIASSIATGVVGAVAWVAAPYWPRSLAAVAAGVGLGLAALVVAGLIVNLVSTASLVALLRRLYLRFGGRESGQIGPQTADSNGRLPITRFRVAAGLVALLIGAAITGAYVIGNLPIEDDVVVIGHRGAPRAAPENSLASIRAAIDAGADLVEIDVQETADGEVVVFHDSDFMKAAGVDLKIWDATTEDLAGIDIGRRFDPGFAGERVPTLAEVLDVCRDKAVVLVELKYYGHDVRLEQRVVDLVEASGITEQTEFMSLKQGGVVKLKELRPDWKVGQLLSVAVGDRSRLTADFLAINASFATRSLIRTAHDRGRKVYVWTVNDPVQVSALVSRGVDGVITDEPAMAKAVLAERASMAPAARLLVELADRFGLVLGRKATPFAEQ